MLHSVRFKCDIILYLDICASKAHISMLHKIKFCIFNNIDFMVFGSWFYRFLCSHSHFKLGVQAHGSEGSCYALTHFILFRFSIAMLLPYMYSVTQWMNERENKAIQINVNWERINWFRLWLQICFTLLIFSMHRNFHYCPGEKLNYFLLEY